MSENNTPEGRLCSCGKGVYIPYKTETTTDYNGKQTVVDIYKCSACGHILRFTAYKEV